MSTRKTLDIDHEITAMLARIEKKKTDHQLRLGEIVAETGIHKLVDADQLRELLLHERDRLLAAKATGPEEHGATGRTFPDKPVVARKGNGHAEPEPGRARAADLLAGAAAQ